MILKFDDIFGIDLADLLKFVHSEENQVGPTQMIVRIKSVTPVQIGSLTSYGITLELLEWVIGSKQLGKRSNFRVDPKFFLRVYEILGQTPPPGCEKVAVKKYPPISPGTSVKTTKENPSITDWTEEARAGRKWGVQGTVLTHHDSHGLCYDVRHDDGTEGCYDPSELEEIVD